MILLHFSVQYKKIVDTFYAFEKLNKNTIVLIKPVYVKKSYIVISNLKNKRE